ncbi:MAG: cellulose synthase operon protein YhjQ/BcsQ [Myxococcota bacterium]
MAQLNCVVLALDSDLRGQLSEALENTGHASVTVAVERSSELEDVVWRVGPDLLLAALDEEPEAVLAAVESLGDRRPMVLICGPQDESDLILRSMRIGVRDYLPLPVPRDELTAVVQSLILERTTSETPERGTVVGVLGVKGGVGATAVTCQLASVLQETGSQCAIVDLNLVHGDVALYHDLSPSFTLADLERQEGEIDRTYVQSLVTLHSSGVGVVAAPTFPEQARRISPARLQRAVALMRDFNHFTLLDLPRDWGDVAVAAIEMVDRVILVTQRDVPTLAHTKLHLGLLERLAIPRSTIHLVANRDEAGSDLSDRDLREFLGRPIDHRLPNDREAMLEVVNGGSSLGEIAPRSTIRQSFQHLAQSLRSWCGMHSVGNVEPARGLARVRNLIWRGRNGLD